METYLEFDFKISPLKPWDEILMAHLLELNFDSFTEEKEGLLAYIPKDLFVKSDLDNHPLMNNPEVTITYTYQEMPKINWNEEWEKNFEAIEVEGKVRIRAEFHEPKEGFHEIVIQPKMSFGTGHHPTTHLMIQQMLEMDFHDKTVLDMGCGTSVLAIFAAQKGAKEVDGIDIDEWSVENSIENAKRNSVSISVAQGTAESLGSKMYDVILANINRNILISDIPTYASVLKEGGDLLLSGLCYFDVQDILNVTQEVRLELLEQKQREEWMVLHLRK